MGNPLKPSFIIRDAATEDIPILIEFQTSLARETENLALDSEVLVDGMNELFKDPAKGKYYVAVADSAVIGCLMITFEWSEWRNGQIIWIQSVYVTQSFRQKGVFRSLYAHVKFLVENKPEYCGIRLYVENANARAKAVYKKLGMNGDHYQVLEWFQKPLATNE